MTASKSIIADLSKDEKLDETYYDIWYRKMQHLLEEQDVLDTITQSVPELEAGATAQQRREYDSLKKKDRIAHIWLLNFMHNDLMLRFERHRTAFGVWIAVKAQYGGTSTTHLRQLNMKFDGYKKRPDHTMRQHLTTMSNMISELLVAGCVLTDEQQVQAVIRSLLASWEYMRVNLTHNDNIKTFEDVGRHLELEEDRLLVERPLGEAYYVVLARARCPDPSASDKEVHLNGDLIANWNGDFL